MSRGGENFMPTPVRGTLPLWLHSEAANDTDAKAGDIANYIAKEPSGYRIRRVTFRQLDFSLHAIVNHICPST